MDCSDRNIRWMSEIGKFKNIRRLNCSGNDLTQLDLGECQYLTGLDCSGNDIASLDIRDLRSLITVDCSGNALTNLSLGDVRGLVELYCRDNNLRTLDLRNCSTTLRADVRGNATLATVYCLASQSITVDGNTEVIAE